ncbi:hypothetical protein CJ030_MR7G011512 [Morella rubra]|uniref:Uncharacterized protein n=1 Tax=Morella rubra TaxID=262757 RepID=A0A6A1V3J1_9ROSI|nr:hypothetical protein CJ030_MR7G011512 [Morella rubra]
MVMQMMAAMMVIMIMMHVADGADTNTVFSPCSDATVQKFDGFTFGLAFSTRESFFFNQTQLSPCDQRLSLSSQNAQVALFRSKVDEISLLTINSSTFNPIMSGAYMVAFAGQKYAARSLPILVADTMHTITSFTLVLEFQRGTLQNLDWKNSGCDACSPDSVCLDNQNCAMPNSKCLGNDGFSDCNLGIQLAFSGTDKNLVALNSWYEVENLRQYSLYGLFSNIHDSIIGQHDQPL